MDFDHGRAEWVALGDLTVGRTIAQPGWRWSTHIRPVVGGDWCQTRHIGVVLSGRLHILMPHPTAHQCMVVDDEDLHSLTPSSVTGSLATTRVPLPGVDWTSSVPCVSATRRRIISNPRWPTGASALAEKLRP